MCNGIALNNLDKAGNYPLAAAGHKQWGRIGIRWEAYLTHGKPGVSGRGTSPGSVVYRAKKGIKLLSPSQCSYIIE